MFEMKLFDSRPVNTGRQIEADMAKVVCIIGMVLVHCFETLYSAIEASAAQDAVNYILVTLLDILFGASTFMFCMGMGVIYSRNSEPAKMMKRGLKLFLYGYLLNVLRYTIPGLLGALSLESEGILMISLEEFLTLDILQFAGLALILFGLLKKLRLPDWGVAVTAVVLSVIGSFARGFNLGMIPNQILGLFVGTETTVLTAPLAGSEPFEGWLESCFPLFNWFIFVAAGYLFGKLLQRCRNKGALYAIFGGGGAVIAAAYCAFAIPGKHGMFDGDKMLSNFYHLTTYEALICICAGMAALGLYYAISHILPQKLQRGIIRISSSINQIYMTHWVMITLVLLALTVTEETISVGITFAIGAVICVLAMLLADRYNQRKKKRRAAKAQQA